MMTHKEAIELTISTHFGINMIDLSLRVMSLIGPSEYRDNEFMDELGVLLKKGDIIKFHFDCHGNGTVLMFPRGTKLVRFK